MCSKATVTIAAGTVSLVVALISCGNGSRQKLRDRELARQLADDRTQQLAIQTIATAARDRVPLLLLWTRQPPANIDECGLSIGLADAFGQLRTKEAIPFLIKRISMRRGCGIDLAPWMKGPETIEWNLPAVRALISIGPDASKALVRAAQDPMVAEDRLAAIFVVARIRDPEARGFLASAVGVANNELAWAAEGLKLLATQR